MKTKKPRHLGMKRQKNNASIFFLRTIKAEKDFAKIPFHRRKQIV